MERIEKLNNLFKGTDFANFEYADFDNAEELIESLETQILETEVIYYNNAIKYLQENDASLKESLSLADDLGYSCKDLNSETLATILKQNNLSQELENLRQDIEDIYANEETED